MGEQLDYKSFYRHTGSGYVDVLRNVHAFLKPLNYLEIGVNSGATLALSKCVTIGIDPKFMIATNVVKSKPQLLLFQQTSDDFFSTDLASSLLSGSLSFAFLDGLHHADNLLRDFINTEKLSAQSTLIAMHDCLPTDAYMARQNQIDPSIQMLTPNPGQWTGDVWKTLFVLQKYRSDLKIVCVNARPTGLVFITNLYSRSTILLDNYEDIVMEMQNLGSTHEHISEFIKSQNIVDTEKIDTEAGMRRILFAS